MKIGLMGRVGDEEGGNVQITLARLARAESQGFDAVWVAADDALGGDAGRSLFAAVQLAERTDSVDIGLWSVLDPGLHPLRLAEDLAMLDIVSGGRLQWAPMGPDVGEPLAIVLQSWRGEAFAHAGPRFEFPSLVCLPAPEQKPHPRLWLSPGEAHAEEMWGAYADSDCRGWLIDSEHASDEALSPGSRALVFRMPVSMQGESALIREAVEALEHRYAPDLLLVWPDPASSGSADAERLQNDFALACLGS